MYILSILLVISLIFSLIITITYFQERSKRNQEKSLRDKLDAQLLNYSRLTDQLSYERNLLSDELGTLRSRMEVLLMEIADEKDKLTFREQEYKDKIIPEAIAKSKAVHSGFMSEQTAPWNIEKFNIKDFRFIGGVVDFIVFDKLSDYNSNSVHIYLMDIKTGKSALSKRQRLIRDAIKSGNISFAIYNSDTDTMKEYPCQQSKKIIVEKNTEN